MAHDYTNRHWVIIPSSSLGDVDFSQVLESVSSREKDEDTGEILEISYTVRRSTDGSKALLKWEGEEPPSSIAALSSVSGPYSYSQIKEIHDSPEWGSEE